MVRSLALLLLLATALEATEVRFATMRLGTSWYVFGATLYKLIHKEMPEGTRLEIMARGGGIANPILVENGKAQIALANRATAVWAFKGHPEVYKGQTHTNLRTLVGGLNPVWISAMAREDYLKSSGHQSLEDILKGSDPVRLVMKPRGSSVPVVADMIFEHMGISREDIIDRGGRIIQVAAQQVPAVLRNRRADLYVEVSPPGHPIVTEVTLTVPMRFLDLPDPVRAALGADGLEPSEVPKFFKGQDKPTRSVNLGTVLITHQNLPEEIAYLITKTICDNQEALVAAHKAWSRFDPRQAWTRAHAGVPLHPGAERYYREQGWMKGDERAQPLNEPIMRAGRQ